MESSILVKAFALLEATAERPSTKSLGDLASTVGLTKSTAHRILRTLRALGYVERLRGGQYRQTGQVLRLVAGADERRLIQASDALLSQLHASTRETVNLGVLRQGNVVYVKVLESPLPLRRVVEPNSTDPFYSTALGRAIVAHLPIEQRELLLSSVQLVKHTPATVTDTDTLQAILDQVYQQGYSLEQDQTDLGVTCIGAAIFQAHLPIAAVSLSIPTARFSLEYEMQLVSAVRSTASQITRQLANHPEPAS
ncbi:MAG: IclR family transcriptional regulator [Pirellulales bacterium]|nr:IclR family transcriptional regulator [Pirellulales bacterium]